MQHATPGGVGSMPQPLAAMLLCAAAGAASAGLHGADVRRGPVRSWHDQYARVTAELTVTSDPRLTRPRVRGDQTRAADPSCWTPRSPG